MSKKQADILTKIRDIRAGNNDVWMSILAIALRAAPEDTKEALSLIRTNDTMIATLTGMLADDAD